MYYLNLPDFKEDFQITCDLKLINIVAGIQSCTSLYSCPYCEGSKVALESGKATTGREIWVAEEHQKRWENETSSNRKLLKNYKSCEFPPIKLSDHLLDVEILFSLPPDQQLTWSWQ